MTGRLYMIRHGRPAASWDEGDPDPGLDETGRAQAEAVAAALMSLAPEHRPRTVATSPLRRCRETAAPLARALGVELEVVEAVAEIPTPRAVPPGERGAWLRDAFGGTWAELRGDIDYADWRQGIVEALVARPGAAVFSHYVALNAAVSAAQGDPRVHVFRPDQGSITAFEVVEGRLALLERGRQAVTEVL